MSLLRFPDHLKKRLDELKEVADNYLKELKILRKENNMLKSAFNDKNVCRYCVYFKLYGSCSRRCELSDIDIYKSNYYDS